MIQPIKHSGLQGNEYKGCNITVKELKMIKALKKKKKMEKCI